MEKNNCPICNNKNFEVIAKIDDLKCYYYLVKCKNCELCFINPLPSKEDLKKYYNIEYEVPEYQKKKVIDKSKKILELLKNMGLNREAKILEIGASYGYFLNEARKYGFIPYGLELSKKACLKAKEYFNLDIKNKDFLESNYSKLRAHFDVVVLLDVLEHIRDQNEIIGAIHYILKKGGYLVLTIPNIDSWEFKVCGKYWEWVSPPAHLYYYSPKTIKKMLEKHGFKVVHLETYKGDSAGNILFQFYLSLKQRIFYNLKYILGRGRLFKVRENIRNNLRNKTTKEGNEFVGIDKLMFKICKFLWKPFKFLDLYRFKKGKGPTILVIAVKQ